MIGDIEYKGEDISQFFTEKIGDSFIVGIVDSNNDTITYEGKHISLNIFVDDIVSFGMDDPVLSEFYYDAPITKVVINVDQDNNVYVEVYLNV